VSLLEESAESSSEWSDDASSSPGSILNDLTGDSVYGGLYLNDPSPKVRANVLSANTLFRSLHLIFHTCKRVSAWCHFGKIEPLRFHTAQQPKVRFHAL
jgi:hypothetical protein